MAITGDQKRQTVARVEKELKRYPVIAVASLQALPGRQYSLIRKKLRGQAELVVARNTLLARALKAAKPDVAAALENTIAGPTALILTTLGPFKLFRLIKESKSKAAAKPGAIAPADIVVPAGETNLAPGPVLTELKQAKVDAKIQGPKVVISRDSLVAKRGEPIPEAVTKVLSKLGIEPMEIGLQVNAVWENGVVYKPDVLDVEPAQYLGWVRQAAAQSLNLAVFARFFTPQTAPLLVTKAARQSRALAVHAGVFEKGVMGDLLAKAARQAGALAGKAPGAA
jgi:large subunit ribosomal protein L10